MDIWTINISFNQGFYERVDNIVAHEKTLIMAKKYADLIDDTVDKALIKDNVTGKIIWLKK